MMTGLIDIKGEKKIMTIGFYLFSLLWSQYYHFANLFNLWITPKGLIFPCGNNVVFQYVKERRIELTHP